MQVSSRPAVMAAVSLAAHAETGVLHTAGSCKAVKLQWQLLSLMLTPRMMSRHSATSQQEVSSSEHLQWVMQLGPGMASLLKVTVMLPVSILRGPWTSIKGLELVRKGALWSVQLQGPLELSSQKARSARQNIRPHRQAIALMRQISVICKDKRLLS